MLSLSADSGTLDNITRNPLTKYWKALEPRLMEFNQKKPLNTLKSICAQRLFDGCMREMISFPLFHSESPLTIYGYLATRQT